MMSKDTKDTLQFSLLVTRLAAHVFGEVRVWSENERQFELGSDGWIKVYFHLPVSLGSTLPGYMLRRCQSCFLANMQQRFWETSAGTSPDCEALPLHYNELNLEINLLSPAQAISSIWSWLSISGPKHTSEWVALHLLAIPLCHPDQDSRGE